jgi:hypothetical protein
MNAMDERLARDCPECCAMLPGLRCREHRTDTGQWAERSATPDLARDCPNCRRMLKSVPSMRCWEHGTDWLADNRGHRGGNAMRALRLARALRRTQ